MKRLLVLVGLVGLSCAVALQAATIGLGTTGHATMNTGTYTGGIERPDVNLVLATSIPEEVCRRINVGYLDPRSIRLTDYMNREDEGILFVDHAGEILHRLAGEA